MMVDLSASMVAKISFLPDVPGEWSCNRCRCAWWRHPKQLPWVNPNAGLMVAKISCLPGVPGEWSCNRCRCVWWRHPKQLPWTHLWWTKSAVYLMFLRRGVAIDVTASDDVTQNSCLERSQFDIVYCSTGQLCPTLGAPAGTRLDPEKRDRERSWWCKHIADKIYYSSVADPHWFKCGSGSGFRIQGAKLTRIQRRYKSHFERLEIRFICTFWSISLLLDADPNSQYGSGSGSRRAKSMRIRIRNTKKLLRGNN